MDLAKQRIPGDSFLALPNQIFRLSFCYSGEERMVFKKRSRTVRTYCTISAISFMSLGKSLPLPGLTYLTYKIRVVLCLDQGSANLFCQGPESDYFRLCGVIGSVSQLLNSTVVAWKQL